MIRYTTGSLLFIGLVLSITPVKSDCTNAVLTTCLQGLDIYGIGVSDSGSVSLTRSATPSRIQAACSNRVDTILTCLHATLETCTRDSLVRRDILGVIQYFTYLCSDPGLKGLSFIPCIEREDTQRALVNCTAAYEKVQKRIAQSNIGDILNYFLGGDGLDDLCDTIISVRLCHVRVTAEHCSVEASVYSDRLFQQIAEQISSFLKCPDPDIETHCESNPCLNGATCFSISSTQTTCACPLQYAGQFCEQYVGIVSECGTSGCRNGGSCQQGSCVCLTGFSGEICQQLPGESADIEAQAASSGLALNQSEIFIGTAVCVLVLLLVIGVALYFVKVRRRDRLVESVTPSNNFEKGLKIPGNF